MLKLVWIYTTSAAAAAATYNRVDENQNEAISHIQNEMKYVCTYKNRIKPETIESHTFGHLWLHNIFNFQHLKWTQTNEPVWTEHELHSQLEIRHKTDEFLFIGDGYRI